MVPRPLSPSPRRSFFLFGARGTGKSTFLEQWFAEGEPLWIDLLVAEEEDRYARRTTSPMRSA
jgi:predicted kinase